MAPKIEFRIGHRVIGGNAPPFVIAEAGINHEGDVKKALQLVTAAAMAGADCIKFQCHITEEEMIPTDIKPEGISRERLWDIIKRCELNSEEEKRVQKECKQRGILYLSTPFSRAAADRLQGMGVPAFKVGSGECNNFPLLQHLAQFKKPVILSTGMNDLKVIRQAVDIFKRRHVPLMLMHCTSMYPTPYSKMRLGAIQEMQAVFGLPVGLSDHSLGIYTCLGAAALGACAFEKHFTLSRSWSGPDVPISIEPQELSELAKGVRAVWEARGGRKTILSEEKPVSDFAYATVVTIRSIRKGERLTMENIWVKRPGVGPLLAKEFDRVLGQRAQRDLPQDVPLGRRDFGK